MEMFVKIFEFIFKGPKVMFLFSVTMISFFIFHYVVNAHIVLSLELASFLAFISWFVYEWGKNFIESQDESYRARKMQSIYYYKCKNITLTHTTKSKLAVEKYYAILKENLEAANKFSCEQRRKT